MPSHSLSGLAGARWERARAALDGLSVGDAFGEQFFGLLARHDQPVERRMLTNPP